VELPIVKADPATSKDVTVVGAVAVKVAVPPVDWETIVEAKFTFDPDSAGVAEGRAPKGQQGAVFGSHVHDPVIDAWFGEDRRGERSGLPYLI
jgi:hypothetical protein